jgi:hypothetical protein
VLRLEIPGSGGIDAIDNFSTIAGRKLDRNERGGAGKQHEMADQITRFNSFLRRPEP